MRFGAIPENPVERIVLSLGLVPKPLLDTLIPILLARTIMVATKIGVFETLRDGDRTSDQIADECGTDADATRKLLNALVGAGYLDLASERFRLTPMARKWLLKESRQSLYDNLLFRFMEWDIVGEYENYVRSGEPMDLHATLHDANDWDLYQRGMRSLANAVAPEVAKRTPVPAGARDLLDIGGSHGYFSVALCRRYQSLHASILDLPQAVEQAAPLLEREGMGDRIAHWPGDALQEDLGTEAWDVVFIANLVHHFSDEENRELARRVARALRPGGIYVIQELTRPESPAKAGQAGTLMDLYFSLTSRSGTWTYGEMADWQREAGLHPRKPIPFRTAPGIGQQVGIKPEGRR